MARRQAEIGRGRRHGPPGVVTRRDPTSRSVGHARASFGGVYPGGYAGRHASPRDGSRIAVDQPDRSPSARDSWPQIGRRTSRPNYRVVAAGSRRTDDRGSPDFRRGLLPSWSPGRQADTPFSRNAQRLRHLVMNGRHGTRPLIMRSGVTSQSRLAVDPHQLLPPPQGRDPVPDLPGAGVRRVHVAQPHARPLACASVLCPAHPELERAHDRQRRLQRQAHEVRLLGALRHARGHPIDTHR